MLDVSCQETGVLDNLFLIAVANGVSATVLPAPGSDVDVVGDIDVRKLSYLKANGVTIGTAGGQPSGIGFYIIGKSFGV